MVTVAVVVVALLLAAYVLVDHRRLARQRMGRVVVFIALLLVPAGTVGIGVSHDVARSTETRFCLSCHEMKPYGQSLLVDDDELVPANHFQKRLVGRENACFTCHRDYALFGDVRTKLNGLRHVWAHYVTGGAQPIKLYKPYSNANCLHCHDGARGFEESKHHETKEVHLADMRAGKQSCLAAGCHARIHEAAEVKDATFWKHASIERTR